MFAFFSYFQKELVDIADVGMTRMIDCLYVSGEDKYTEFQKFCTILLVFKLLVWTTFVTFEDCK